MRAGSRLNPERPHRRQVRWWPALLALWAASFCGTAARALNIELKDIASDRIERQRNFAVSPSPLPGTPDTAQLQARLTEAGLKAGAPLLIRIFKAESELELWMQKDGAFARFATYPICNWSGSLGPKLREGDKQTPEGFYTITSRQLHRLGRWRHALNLGFPNAYDESLKRDGSYILVHGGCSSVGCFAMTDPVILEIFQLTSAALRAGQQNVPVHVFPFRMTSETVAKYRDDEWSDFWSNLKEGYDSFERTKQPPRVSVCRGKYVIQDASSPQEAGAPLPLGVCGETAAQILASNGSAWLVPLTPDLPSQTRSPVELRPAELLSQEPVPELPSRPLPAPLKLTELTKPQTTVLDPKTSPAAATSFDPAAIYEFVPRIDAGRAKSASGAGASPRPAVRCNLGLASCRRFAALLDRRVTVQKKNARAKTQRTLAGNR